MSFLTRTGKPLPQSILASAESAKKDPVNRREFLALASAFGATAATAYSMIGMAAPAMAAAHSLSIWRSGKTTVHSHPPCWKAGKSTTMPPNTR